MKSVRKNLIEVSEKATFYQTYPDLGVSFDTIPESLNFTATHCISNFIA